MAYGYMHNWNQANEYISIPKGQVTAGTAIGILVLDICYPLLPGNVANATTFNFPVYYKCLEGASDGILRADPIILDLVIKGGRELERQGVRAIVGACGYFANYQKVAAAELNVPTFLSSLLQIPIIARGLKPNQKVGVICADANALSPAMLSACGVDDPSIIVVAGAQDLPDMQNILQSCGHFNSLRFEQGLCDIAKALVSKNPDIGAILLECSDMPPYAWSIQNSVKLPVFDFTTMINWVYSAVVRHPFAGFI